MTKILEIIKGVHAAGFEMIDDYSFWAELSGPGWGVVNVILGVIMILCVLALDFIVLGLIVYGIYKLTVQLSILVRTKEVITYKVVGTVVNKEYMSGRSYWVYNVALRMPIYQHVPESYNVTVGYEGLTTTLNSKSLYSVCMVNDSIDLILKERIGRTGKVIKRSIGLPG